MTIADLFVKLGFKFEGAGGLAAADRGMSGANLKALALKASVAAAVFAFVRMQTAAAGAALNMDKFIRATGLSSDRMDEWRFAAERNGVAGDAMATSVKGIQSAVAQIRLGRGDIAPWQLLGIKPDIDPFKVLDNLREKIKGMDPAIARGLASSMGVSEDVFTLLTRTDAQLGKIDAKYKLSKGERAGLVSLSLAWKELFQTVSLGFRKVFAASSNFTRHLVEALTAAVDWVSKFVIKLPQASAAMKAIVAILAVIAALSFAIFVPWGGWMIVVALIALAIEDLWVALKGGDSVIGALSAKFGIDFEAIRKVINNAIGELSTFMQLFEDKDSFPSSLLTGITNAFKALGEAIEFAFGWYGKWLKALSESKTMDGIMQQLMPKEKQSATIMMGGKMMPNPQVQGMQAFQRAMQQTNNISVSIDGAGDPSSVGREAAAQIQSMITGAGRQMPAYGQ